MRSLSGRLLALTAVVVFVVEVFVLVPSLGAAHQEALRERIDLAQTAALAVEAAPLETELPPALREELLVSAGVKRVSLKRDEQRSLLLSGEPEALDGPIVTYRLEAMGWAGRIRAALDCLAAPPGRLVRVIAAPQFDSGVEIDVLMDERPVKVALARYAWRTFGLSLLLSAAAGAVVFIALQLLLVRPIRRLTRDIERFRAAPEDETVTIRPSGRDDEIGRAETALAEMEAELRAALRHRERLAGLGAAVAKIAHDMRNSLATAGLVTERLAASDDPKVRQIAPRLERAIARAGALAEQALVYGRAQEPAPRLDRVAVAEALAEAAADALARLPEVRVALDAPDDLAVTADPDHLHRILVNLMRNAGEALSEQKGRTAPGTVFASARLDRDDPEAPRVRILVADDGPGLPQKVVDALFQPFVSAQRRGGTGLGLAIARELARAMGGDVALAATGAQGAAFEVTLPAAV